MTTSDPDTPMSKEVFARVWDAACARRGETPQPRPKATPTPKAEPLDHRTLAQLLAKVPGAEYTEYKADPSVVYVSKVDDQTGCGWKIAVFADLRWWINQNTAGEATRVAEGQAQVTDRLMTVAADILLQVPTP